MSQFDELPEGWEEISLGEILKEGRIGLVRSASQQNLSEGIPYVRMQHYDLQGNWKFQNLTRVDATDEELKTYKLCPDDILFNTRNSFELVGKVAIWSHDKEGYIYNNNLMRLRFFKETLPKWIAYQMIAPKFRNNLEGAKSATTSVCAIYGKELVKQKLLLSPLHEQQRIVDKIEALTARSRKARAALDEIPALLDQFRQSVLAAAFRGDLTADWRAQNPDVEPAEALLERIKERVPLPKKSKSKSKFSESLPSLAKSWCWSSFEEMAETITKGSSPKWQGFQYLEEGIPFVRSQNVSWGYLDLVDVAYLSKDFNDHEPRSILKNGDILLNIVGASIGRAALANQQIEGGNINQAVAIIRLPKEFILSECMMYFLISPLAQKIIHQGKVDVARANVSLADIKFLPFPIIPFEEQKEIVNCIKSSFLKISQLEDLLNSSNNELSQLDQSILAKAFRGELVPQDPSDEPAAVLLDRIRAERERLGSGKKRGKAKA